MKVRTAVLCIAAAATIRGAAQETWSEGERPGYEYSDSQSRPNITRSVDNSTLSSLASSISLPSSSVSPSQTRITHGGWGALAAYAASAGLSNTFIHSSTSTEPSSGAAVIPVSNDATAPRLVLIGRSEPPEDRSGPPTGPPFGLMGPPIPPVADTLPPVAVSSTPLPVQPTLSLPAASPVQETSTPIIDCSPTSSPTFAPFCTRTPIPDCIPCENQPGGKWCGLTIDTDYYDTWPKTCFKVTCKAEITNQTMAPDGVERMVFGINGQFPGPLMEATWGDTVEVQVTNSLADNGTSLHFHGVRQLRTAQMDGVPSITQCPIAGNGGTMNYTWVASQYGHSWYHSHYSLQAWEGVMGPLIVHGPTNADFDIDLGIVMLQDWLHTPAFQQFQAVQQKGSPMQDNILINGKNVYGSNGVYTGERAQFVFTPGKKHRIQLVMTSLDSAFAVSIDGHNLTVIAADWVPIIPYTTQVLKMGIGQRYDIIVEANQPVGDYWLRVDNLDFSVDPGVVPPCGAKNFMQGNTNAVIHYAGSCGTPTTLPFPHDTVCEDEPYASLVPWVAKNAGAEASTFAETLTLAQNASTQIYRWHLSGSTFQVTFDRPTLLDLYHGATSYEGPLALTAETAGVWIYVVIESPVPLSHPIHLHGHDVYILAAGSGPYRDQPLNTLNPVRRDVATLPIAGYLVLGFYTDNPGTWLMHCHIGWHVSMGFALQFIVDPEEARKDVDEDHIQGVCDGYMPWAARGRYKQIDSGV